VVDAEVGSRLRLRREELRLTKDQLAAELGMSGRALDDIEPGLSRLFPAQMFSAAQKLGVPVSYFFEGLG
jgi:transcriptional regulator with XRE-family HTH domain